MLMTQLSTIRAAPYPLSSTQPSTTLAGFHLLLIIQISNHSTCSSSVVDNTTIYHSSNYTSFVDDTTILPFDSSTSVVDNTTIYHSSSSTSICDKTTMLPFEHTYIHCRCHNSHHSSSYTSVIDEATITIRAAQRRLSTVSFYGYIQLLQKWFTEIRIKENRSNNTLYD
ncbi:hypothetical protein CHS0354_005072, partial [Potamilus streckersoni]